VIFLEIKGVLSTEKCVLSQGRLGHAKEMLKGFLHLKWAWCVLFFLKAFVECLPGGRDDDWLQGACPCPCEVHILMGRKEISSWHAGLEVTWGMKALKVSPGLTNPQHQWHGLHVLVPLWEHQWPYLVPTDLTSSTASCCWTLLCAQWNGTFYKRLQMCARLLSLKISQAHCWHKSSWAGEMRRKENITMVPSNQAKKSSWVKA
jgi:hypothetical protein